VSTSPPTLTLRHLREQGWPLVEVVEHWNPHARIRQDMFGFVDVIAVRRGETLAVQTTSAANVSARITKIADHPNVGAVREAGWSIRVHGWRKRGGRWELHRDEDVS
jgi:carbonic anhydrase